MINFMSQFFTVSEYIQMSKYLWHSIISEHGQMLLTSKLLVLFLITQLFIQITKRANQISNQDLSSLIKEYLSTLVNSFIPEPIKVLYNQFNQQRSTIVTLLKQLHKFAIKLSLNNKSNLTDEPCSFIEEGEIDIIKHVFF